MNKLSGLPLDEQYDMLLNIFESIGQNASEAIDAYVERAKEMYIQLMNAHVPDLLPFAE